MIPILRRLLWASSPALLLLVTAGCSTIITSGRKDVNFRSSPAGARVLVSDEKGVAIFKGETPTVVTLKTGRPYFIPKKYTVEVSKDGYEPVSSQLKGTVSGWYAGNLVFGGLLGLLVIDPLTGAMYTLPKEKSLDLVPTPSAMTGSPTAASGPALTAAGARSP